MTYSVAAEVDRTIEEAVRFGASDIHWDPQASGVRVRYRIHGRLQEIRELPSAMCEAVVIRVKGMARMNVAEKRLPQDGSCSCVVDGRSYELRIAVLPVLYGESVAVRILGNALRSPTLDNIGLTTVQRQVLRGYLHRPYGLIVTGGATGTGKSTTLYAALKEIDRERLHVVTIEDPIEYRMAGVNQMQVGESGRISFAAGLRSVLRADPDVIMVGEIRDAETAEIAVRAAMTGHLVLATIHAGRAEEIPARFFEMGIEPYLLAAALRVVIAQRLVGELCPHCRYAVEEGSRMAGAEPCRGYEACGCEACRQTGIARRHGVFEVLPIDAQIRGRWQEGSTSLPDAPQETMTAQIARLAAAGKIGQREAAGLLAEAEW